ncbi:MAG: hypothetical protein IPI29_06580 [Ignavibacteria bacterium]|nr:hypothetical protein [Ignavibacteria bacterium]
MNATGNINIQNANSYRIGGETFLSRGPSGGGDNVFVGNTTNTTNTGFFGTFVGTGAGTSRSGRKLEYSCWYSIRTLQHNGRRKHLRWNGLWRSQARLTTGSNNTFMGAFAAFLLTTGNNNTGIGILAVNDLADGSNNTALGAYAGQNVSSASQNTLIGANAGNAIVTEAGNTLIGYNAQVPAGVSNSTAIGQRAYASGNDVLVLGATAGVNGLQRQQRSASTTQILKPPSLLQTTSVKRSVCGITAEQVLRMDSPLLQAPCRSTPES